MPNEQLPGFECDSDTHNRIVDTATRLFALKGFKAVTLKDIAKAVGIKIASIYYYYKDKDALIDKILSRFEEVYTAYHNWYFELNENAESLEEVLDNLFAPGFMGIHSPVARLGMAIVLKEQHNHEYARQCAFKHIYQDTVQNIKASFDRLIEKKVIPPSDTTTLSTLFMYSIIAGNEIYIHEFSDTQTPIDTQATYHALRKLMTSALTEGVLSADES